MAQGKAFERLVAAGASPQRAKLFTENVMRKVPTGIGTPRVGSVPSVSTPKVTSVPSVGVVKKPSDYYSDDNAAASEAFRADKGLPGYELPSFDSPEIVPYFDFSYGKGSYQKLLNKAYKQYAPTLAKAKGTNQLPYEKFIVDAIQVYKLNPSQILTQIVADEEAGDPDFLAFPVSSKDGDRIKAASDYVNRLYNENANLEKGIDAVITGTYTDYRYKLPSAKTKYGISNNFKEGTIDVLNNVWAFDKYKAREQQLQKAKVPASAIKKDLLNFKYRLLRDVTKSKRTPFKDEVARREAIAGK